VRCFISSAVCGVIGDYDTDVDVEGYTSAGRSFYARLIQTDNTSYYKISDLSVHYDFQFLVKVPGNYK